MKRGLFYLFLLFIFLGVIAILLWHFNFLKLQESEVYQPSQEFKPAFEALEADSPMDNPEYDLEETVRAMNALEVAQCHSADFVSYLEYVARQDFSRVAPEVLEQKKKLFAEKALDPGISTVIVYSIRQNLWYIIGLIGMILMIFYFCKKNQRV